MSKVEVACLHSAAELAAICEKQNVRLTPDANRTLLNLTLSKMGTANAQKIVQKLVQKGESGWGDEHFEVEAVRDYTVHENVTYYFIKWKGWSNLYNSWEPESNLDCPELISEFHASRQKHKRPNMTAMSNMEPETKKQRIDELVDTLLNYSSTITTANIVEAFEQIKASSKLAKFGTPNQCSSRALRKVGCHLTNKRSKAYRLYTEEVRRALKDWERHLNKVNTDPAPIFVENNVDLEGPPQNFHYINDYIAGEGVVLDANPVVGCECNDCMKEKSSCCGCSAGSEFAYYAVKRVRLPPGYPIYECNKQCKCGPECPNRVVQLGRKHRVCIFRTSNGRGWGVKAMQKIKKGSFVMEYVGEVVTNEEAERRGKTYDANGMTYLFDLDYQDPDCPFTVDAGIYGNVSHFVNHSCDPNLTVYGVWINNLDPRLPRIALFASKDIQRGEELTFDYMMTGEMVDPGEELTIKEPDMDSMTSQCTHDDANTSPPDDSSLVSSTSASMADQDSSVEPPKVPASSDLTNTEFVSPLPADSIPGAQLLTQVSGDSSVLLDDKNCEESVGYASCSSSVLSASDVAVGDDAELFNSSSTAAPFFRRPKITPLASKYRMMCQCGAKNCRRYLY